VSASFIATVAWVRIASTRASSIADPFILG
jgi:hypothetical protein